MKKYMTHYKNVVPGILLSKRQYGIDTYYIIYDMAYIERGVPYLPVYSLTEKKFGHVRFIGEEMDILESHKKYMAYKGLEFEIISSCNGAVVAGQKTS